MIIHPNIHKLLTSGPKMEIALVLHHNIMYLEDIIIINLKESTMVVSIMYPTYLCNYILYYIIDTIIHFTKLLMDVFSVYEAHN